VVFWLTVLYLSFGLFAPRNATAFITGNTARSTIRIDSI
jgi:hypothetical protein